MEIHRRGFLKSAAATGIALAERRLPRGFVQADEPLAPVFDINGKLKEIAALARECCQVTSVEEHLVDHPTIGLTQWPWAHWRRDVAESLLSTIEIVNREQLCVMERVFRTIPDAGFDNMVHEGLIAGGEAEQFAYFQNVHEELIRQQSAIANDDGSVHDWTPSDDVVREELKRRANQFRPVNQVVKIADGFRQFRLSPVARLGAAYIASILYSGRLLAAEDPYLDAKAEEAEQSGDPELIEEWVIQKRNEHFVRVMCEYRARMMLLIAGHNHDITNEIAKSNCAGPEAISHIIITVNGVAAAERIPEKNSALRAGRYKP